MLSLLQKNHRAIFYSLWLLLALTQAASTELIADEAYYWVYSKFLAWGYFDHPPMIALLIKTGYSLFHNEFGVRLICALLSVFTLIITESLLDKKNPFLFYTIALGIGTLQIVGFLAVPDTPLLFFTAVFFYAYRNFTQKNNWRSAIWLAVSIALLFYTKYHGVLIVLFVFLSNLKLLLRWQTWLAAFFVLLLFAPHLWWQWEHDWVSFRYHLFESNVSVYKFSYTTEYILGQLLLTGPLAGLILLPAAFLYRTKNETEKALKFTLVGLLVFFLVSSFRGKVEPNWTMPLLIPLLILSHQFLLTKTSWIKPLRIISFISLLLIMAGRIYLVVDIGPENSVKRRFQHHKEWAMAITEITGDKPVVFYNSYQWASLFWFYSGISSHSLNAYWERRNNFNFWPTGDNLTGKPVYLADVFNHTGVIDSVNTKKGRFLLIADSSYAALERINFFPEKIIANNGVLRADIKPGISDLYLRFLKSNPGIETQLVLGIFKGKEIIKEINTGLTVYQLTDLKTFSLSLNIADIKPGKYDCRLGLKVKDYLVTHNSKNFCLVIP